MWEDGLPTTTSKTQNALEKKLLPFYQDLEGIQDAEEIHDFLVLHRENHVAYLHSGLGQLSSGFAVLDASRTWIVYWLVHSLALLGAPLPKDVTADDIVAFLQSCQHPAGGYGGGPMQLAHLAPTYAAVAAAVTVGGKALGSIDRAAVRSFLLRMCIPPEQGGGFSVHEGKRSSGRHWGGSEGLAGQAGWANLVFQSPMGHQRITQVMISPPAASHDPPTFSSPL